ncbi:unnamed protein product [Prunus armeniaca]|uniref:Transmembrane protein n=1 Tax=Prunus armeniaca TaxID=36596 RepID=A0A6J5XB10_PRUAR|nr:unnamed protein product [Prunus armeniaca]CAB4310071.1 unnamed protein product [Prunus armeniaca]
MSAWIRKLDLWLLCSVFYVGFEPVCLLVALGVGLGVGSCSRGRVGVEEDVVGREMVGVGYVVVASFIATVVAMEGCGGRGGLWMNFRIYSHI